MQLKQRNFRKGGATIHLNLQICLNFFRKYHEMVDLFMDFKMIYIYNMLQTFTLEHSVLLRNVLTRFSLSFRFFLFSDHYGTFSWSIFQCILLTFFYLKDQTFLYKLWGQIFKVYIRCSDIRKSWKALKTVCAILSLKRPLYFYENEFKKNSAPTICRQKFFLHFETKFNIFRATGGSGKCSVPKASF